MAEGGVPPARLRREADARPHLPYARHVSDHVVKTVVQNFMLAQLERFDAQQLFIDKDRGAEIFVRACGGTYLALRNGEPTGFAPFKALDPSPANRAFLVKQGHDSVVVELDLGGMDDALD